MTSARETELRKKRKNMKNLKLSKVNHPTIKGVKDNPGIGDYAGELI
jgi:sulfur-oxidizing protein SoxB